MRRELLAGRDCGACTMCCIVPAIDEPDIQKKPGTPCRHACPEDRDEADTASQAGCRIYDARPAVCRDFFCGWRMMPELDENWRPDRSRVFITLERVQVPGRPDVATAMTFMLVGDVFQTARSERFITVVRKKAMESVAMYLAMPGPPGSKPLRITLPPMAMLEAARRGRDHVKALLEQAVKFMSAQPFEPLPITHSGNDVSAPLP
jgi:hypothetical protein